VAPGDVADVIPAEGAPMECQPLVRVFTQRPLFVPSAKMYAVLPDEVAAGDVPVARVPPSECQPLVRVRYQTPLFVPVATT